jgi:hypothetical protein
LFEVKTNQNTSTRYTAIGQLIVYGAAQARPPKRYLVLENPVEDLNFLKALADQQIACKFQARGSATHQLPRPRSTPPNLVDELTCAKTSMEVIIEITQLLL